MAPPIIYLTDLSPPCRAVLLTAAAAGIKIDAKETNLMEKEHLSEEFLKINPQHTVPAMNDNGFVTWDSHAIITYLVDKYAKNDVLYPKDLELRTIINQRLYFDNAILFAHVKGFCFPAFFKGAKNVEQEKIDAAKDALGILEKILGDNDWLAGKNYTLADISCVVTLSSLAIFVSLVEFPKLAAWLKRCEDQIPGYAQANGKGNAGLKEQLRTRLTNFEFP